MGSNMAENHPVGFQWVMEARERGATIVHVDPRFTRTSAVATMHVPIRPGTDIAFLGGIIRYILENDRAFTEYVVNYTNAPVILRSDFRDTEDGDGFFSGWEPDKHGYLFHSWMYEGMDLHGASGQRQSEEGLEREPSRQSDTLDKLLAGEPPFMDKTLQHPRCVYQVLKRHYRRYTPEMVAAICGIEPQQLIAVAEALCANSGRERTSAMAYSVAWTQHTFGVQMIRAAAIVQLLLGNIGRPGGGILALRGHASIQGSTDIPTLFDLLPGYIPMPHAKAHSNLRHFIESEAAKTGFWGNLDKYMRQPAQSVVRLERHGNERLPLRSVATHQRRPFDVSQHHGDARRKGERLLYLRGKPGGRFGEQRPAPARAGESRMAGRARLH